MISFIFALCFLCASVLIQDAAGHSYHLGACPTIEPMPNFDMQKMLGIWYVIEKTSTGSSCLVYNITKTTEPGEYQIEEISQHFLLALTPLKHGYHYKGTLRVIDNAIPAKMIVRFPLSVAGSATFTIFGTDYENYAGIFTCQKLSFAHRQSVAILSREKTLDKMYTEKLHNKLSAAHIDPFDVSIISQTNCPRNQSEGYNININSDTISTKAAADLIRKTGEKIGDGFEYVADKSKVLYNKLAKTEESHPTNDKLVNGQVTENSEAAEWLP